MLKVSERRQWPQTQLKDIVTGLFNTKLKKTFFSSQETTEAFLVNSTAASSSVAGFKVQKIRKNEK